MEIAGTIEPEMVVLVAHFLRQSPSASRFEVIDWIVERAGATERGLRELLLEDYSRRSKQLLKSMKIVSSLGALRETDSRAWGLVSATDEADLFEICAHHQISQYFSGGLFGSPATKETNLRKALDQVCVNADKTVYLGDRLSDLRAANQVGMNFIFVSDWSDAAPADLAELNLKPKINRISDLVS